MERLWIIGLALLLPTTAWADAVTTDVARRASVVHERDCSDVSSAGATQAARAMERVVPLLAEVSEHYDRSKEPFLLYWRGMLQDCLGQRDRAVQDLQQFLLLAGDDTLQAAPVAEARRRLRRLGESVEAARKAPAGAPGFALGGALLGVGGALGGLGAWQGSEAMAAQAAFDAGNRPWDETVAIFDAGAESSNASTALYIGALASGVGGVVSFVVGGTRGSSPSVAVLPTEGGFVATFGGRW